MGVVGLFDSPPHCFAFSFSNGEAGMARQGDQQAAEVEGGGGGAVARLLGPVKKVLVACMKSVGHGPP